MISLLLLLSRFSCVQLCAIPQTAAHQAPPSLGFSRQEHCSGLPLPSPDKPAANIILKAEKLKAFPLRSGIDKGVHLHHYYSTQFWKSSYSNQRRKINKGIQIRNEKVKFSLFADMILCIENTKDSIKKLPELMSEFSKVAGYKISTQK